MEAEKENVLLTDHRFSDIFKKEHVLVVLRIKRYKKLSSGISLKTLDLKDIFLVNLLTISHHYAYQSMATTFLILL